MRSPPQLETLNSRKFLPVPRSPSENYVQHNVAYLNNSGF
jgi:hypothetical protein